jgi:hypothetical protein
MEIVYCEYIKALENGFSYFTNPLARVNRCILTLTLTHSAGMNLMSGWEASPTAFPTAILCSCIGSATVSLACLNLLSGRTMRRQAVLRLNEMETLTAALSDIAVVDHILQSTVERGQSLDKAKFSALLQRANGEREISGREVDILFDVFDRVKDGNLNQYDFDEGGFAAGDGTTSSSTSTSSNAVTTDGWITTTGK